MSKKSIIFFTTNSIWGGSEILWTQAAKQLAELGFNVSAVAAYDFTLVRDFISEEKLFFDLSKRFDKIPLLKRAINKSGLKEFKAVDNLEKFVEKNRPCLAIISQGNNVEGMEFMEFCVKKKIEYATITHLVVVSKWPMMNDGRLNILHGLFRKSLKNFFVSKYTQRMSEKFIGYKIANSQIIYNPFIKNANEEVAYPKVINENYKVALLGRLENYHKGYDLLIDVISQEKWKNRKIHFTIYGAGPHLKLINRLIALNDLKSITATEHVEDIMEVWKNNHLLLMPSRLEGQSLTLIEAMNFKRACVVTNVGGVEELIKEGVSGFIAEYPAPAAIDSALERAWEKRNEWGQMGIEAYLSIKANHPKDAIEYFIDLLTPFINNCT